VISGSRSRQPRGGRAGRDGAVGGRGGPPRSPPTSPGREGEVAPEGGGAVGGLGGVVRPGPCGLVAVVWSVCMGSSLDRLRSACGEEACVTSGMPLSFPTERGP
jgi:hypothetical protein